MNALGKSVERFKIKKKYSGESAVVLELSLFLIVILQSRRSCLQETDVFYSYTTYYSIYIYVMLEMFRFNGRAWL